MSNPSYLPPSQQPLPSVAANGAAILAADVPQGGGAYSTVQYTLAQLAPALVPYLTGLGKAAVQDGISVTGTTTAAALILPANCNIITSCAIGGIVTPDPAMVEQRLLNRCGVAITAMPPPGQQFENYGINQPVQIPVGGNTLFIFSGATQWRIA